MKVVLVSSKDVWSFNGVGGSDSLNRRLIQGFEELGEQVDTYFAADGITGYFRFLYMLLKYRKEDYNIIVYRLKPLYRLACIVALFRYKRSMVLIPFEPTRLKSITLLSYVLISKKRLVVSKNLQSLIKNRLNVSTHLLEPPVPKEFIESAQCETKNYDVLFVGRVDPRKGFNIVLDLYENLRDYGVRFAFYVVYNRRDVGVDQLLNRCRTLGVELNVVGINRYSKELDQNLKIWLDSAEYFVQPYKTISSTVDSPLLLYEATSRGLSILTTDIPQTMNVNSKGRFPLDDFVERAKEVVLKREKIISRKMQIRSEAQVALQLKNLMNI